LKFEVEGLEEEEEVEVEGLEEEEGVEDST
jgi:hypothetical protein